MNGPVRLAPLRAPLCPAGHLPLKGGDWPSQLLSPTSDDWRKQSGNPISPLEGEMSGRTEGGNIESCTGAMAP